ncbi:MAG: MASE1 domain-containing protein [Actinomycetes bacterium]
MHQAVVRLLVLVIGYVVLARYSLALHDLSGLGAVFWPGAGLSLGVLLVSPQRWWPMLLAGVFVAELGNDVVLGYGVVPSLWWAAANVIEPLTAATLLRRAGVERLGDMRGVAWFTGSVALGTLVGATVGAIGTGVGVSSLPYLVTLGQWWIGDALGALTIAPAVLLVRDRSAGERLRDPVVVGGLVALVAVTVLVFGRVGVPAPYLSDYLVLVPMVLLAVRGRVVGAALAVLVVAQVANAAHALGMRAPQAAVMSEVQASAQLKAFLVIVSLTVLLLGAAVVSVRSSSALAAARQQLLAVAWHELRAPLVPIVGFGEILSRQLADPQQRRMAEAVHRNGRQLQALVDDLLQMSTSLEDGVPVEPTPVAVGEVLDELARDQADVHARCDDDVVALVDRTHLVQILTNLVVNGLRHGEPPVRLSAHTVGGTCVVVVEDSGDGVPDWFVPEMFEAFAQAEPGTPTSRPGLGLGLAIARDLAVANRGVVRYEPGVAGARFEVVLPAGGSRSGEVEEELTGVARVGDP